MGSCLKILRGVPLNSSYTDTIAPHKDYTKGDYGDYVNTRDAVLAYFKKKAVFSTKTNETDFQNKAPIAYVRESDSTVRVNVKRDALEGCNYLMFTNDLPSDTYDENDDSYFWHFAFIDSLEYISDGATRVYFTIDVLQTWMPFITVQEALVNREHAMKDEIGDNIIEEPLSIGQYVSAGDEYLIEDASTTYHTVWLNSGLIESTKVLTDWGSKHRFYSNIPAALVTTFTYNKFKLDNYYVALVSYSTGRTVGLFSSEINGRTPYGTETGQSKSYNWNTGGANDVNKNSINFYNGINGNRTIGVRIDISSVYKLPSVAENDIYWLFTLLNKIVGTLKGEVVDVTLVPLKFLDVYTAVEIRDSGWAYVGNVVQYVGPDVSTRANNNAPFGRVFISRNFTGALANVKNNKVHTYPFTRIIASSQNANVIYRPEFFKKKIIQDPEESTPKLEKTVISFVGTLSITPTVSLTVAPESYEIYSKNGEKEEVLRDENWYELNYSGNFSLTESNFPTLQYAIEEAQYYRRDSLIGDVSRMLAGVLQGGFKAYATSWEKATTPLKYIQKQVDKVQAIGEIGTSILSFAGSAAAATQAPARQGGNASNANALITGETGIDLRVEIPSESELKAIDSYFTTYGYAMHTNKSPAIFSLYAHAVVPIPNSSTETDQSITIRPSFNYIEAEQMSFLPKSRNISSMFTLSEAAFNNFKGYMPTASELAIIRQVFSRGITFWEKPNQIGNYAQDNQIRRQEINE